MHLNHNSTEKYNNKILQQAGCPSCPLMERNLGDKGRRPTQNSSCGDDIHETRAAAVTAKDFKTNQDTLSGPTNAQIITDERL
jgi:hypothetical protein